MQKTELGDATVDMSEPNKCLNAVRMPFESLLTRGSLSFLIPTCFLIVAILLDSRGANEQSDLHPLEHGKSLSNDDLLRLIDTQAAVGDNAGILYLSEIDLRGAVILKNKKLNKINFYRANLRKAMLQGVIVTDCDFSYARLCGADLTSAQLQDTSLEQTDCTGAIFDQVFVHTLPGFTFDSTHLEKTRWNAAQLAGVTFLNCRLDGSVFGQWYDTDTLNNPWIYYPPAALKGAQFVSDAHSGNTPVSINDANFDGCDLSGSTFHVEGARSNFDNSNLTGAKLQGNFREATFINANLEDAKLSGDFTRAVFEPQPKALPYLPALVSVHGLDQLRYQNSPVGLTELRTALKEAGMRQQERQVNYAIQRARYEIGRQNGAWVEYWFNTVLFDFSCRYGLDPGRPLIILLLSILVFTLPYLTAIFFRSRIGQSGLWIVRIERPVHKPGRQTRPIPIKLRMHRAGTLKTKTAQIMARILRTIPTALYFSALTAFSIGFREINVGSWISRLQGREYTFRATGWVRSVAGAQALLSVYLLALWILTYFGRPFE